MPRTAWARWGALVTAVLVLSGMGPMTPAPTAHAADTCSHLTWPVYRSSHPTLRTDLVTPWRAEHAKSQSTYGFVQDRGIMGHASIRDVAGLVRVVRLYNRTSADFLYAVTAQDIAAAEAAGFARTGTQPFYASASALSCTVPVHRVRKGADHKVAVGDQERAALVADGWSDQGAIFHVARVTTPTPTPTPTTAAPAPPAPAPAPQPTTGTFSIAVIPDTQGEMGPNDTRFENRTQWLAANKAALNLSYALHTGDVTNWGWIAPDQIAIARRATAHLENAGIPHVYAIGNHDTAVVGHNGVAGSRGYGGSAYVNNPECVERFSAAECKSWLLVRRTAEFNQAFPVSRAKNVGGTFEAGKIDNVWTTFEADGVRWLVLTIEPWPRPAAVAWANEVVKNHPRHNVIVQTHSFMTGGGGIDASRGGYGSTSGQYLFDNLIKLYPNIVMTFSGHQGEASARSDTGVHGNTILSFLGNFGSNRSNPVRIVTIDADTGRVTTRIEVPQRGEVWSQYSTSGTITITR